MQKEVRGLNSEQPCNDLEQAMQKHGPYVQRLAFVYMKNRYDAEDASQEVFVTYLEKAPRFDSAQKEKAWLMKVTANRCKSMLRAKYRLELPIPDDLSYLPPEENLLLSAVLRLEEKYRIPIHLHYYEGYSLAEIARLMNTTGGTVASWLSRARSKLMQELKEDYFEE